MTALHRISQLVQPSADRHSRGISAWLVERGRYFVIIHSQFSMGDDHFALVFAKRSKSGLVCIESFLAYCNRERRGRSAREIVIERVGFAAFRPLQQFQRRFEIHGQISRSVDCRCAFG